MARSDITKYPGVAEKFAQLEKSRRRQVLTATVEGQTVFTITNGAYVVGSETLDVIVGTVPQPPTAYTETSSTSITLSEGVPIGTKVILYWLEGKLPVQFGHNTSHYSDGQDPIDVTKLKNYQAEVADKIGILQTKKANIWIDIKSDYGAKGNGVTDDTQKFYDAINYLLSNGGGFLYIPKGVYIVSSKISFNSLLRGIKIVGEAPYATTIKNISTDWTFEFTKGVQDFEVANLTIDCNQNKGNGISFGSTSIKSYITNVTVSHCTRGIEIQGFAYFYIKNFTLGVNNSAFEYGLKIGGNNAYTQEFLYLKESSLDGFSSNNGTGVQIESGSSVYIENTDICNFGSGYAIDARTRYNIEIKMLFVTRVNVIRCDKGIQLFADAANLTQVSIVGLTSILRGESVTEKSILTNRTGAFVVTGVQIDNLHLRKLGSVIADAAIDFLQVSNCELNVSSNFANAKYNLGGVYSQVKLKSNDFRQAKDFSFTGDGTTTSFVCSITTNSPFSNTPAVMVNTDKAIAFGRSISNTLNGELKTTVTFATAPPSGTFKITTFVVGQGIN